MDRRTDAHADGRAHARADYPKGRLRRTLQQNWAYAVEIIIDGKSDGIDARLLRPTSVAFFVLCAPFITRTCSFIMPGT